MAEYRNSDDTKGATKTTLPHGSAHSDQPPIDQNLLIQLSTSVLSSDRRAVRRAVDNALSSNVSPEDIADYYIPMIARQLGDAWCVDEIGFADVTIGASRLQAVLRELVPAWTGDSIAAPTAPRILLAVLPEIYHTLGAMVLAGQLRRKGVSVRLALGADVIELIKQLRRGHYDALFISASVGDSLENLRKVIESVRTVADAMPIVLGGSIVGTHPDIAELTGATFVTNDPDEALSTCDLTIKPLKNNLADT